jgi:hypothetical protein
MLQKAIGVVLYICAHSYYYLCPHSDSCVCVLLPVSGYLLLYIYQQVVVAIRTYIGVGMRVHIYGKEDAVAATRLRTHIYS